MEKPLHHFDKRIVQRSIAKGILSEEEATSRLAALPDRSDNVMPPEEVEVLEVSLSPPGSEQVDPATGGA